MIFAEPMINEIYLFSRDNNLIDLIRDTLQPLGYVIITMGELEIFSLFPDSFHGPILIDSSILGSFIKDLPYTESSVIISSPEEKGFILEAMRRGAYGYLEKPLDAEELIIIINKIIGPSLGDEIITPRGSKMKKIMKGIKELSKEDLPVLIRGEDGTDLGYYARALHRMSKRKDRFFLSLKADLKDRNIQSLIRSLKNRYRSLEGCTIFLEDLFDLGMIRELAAVTAEKKIGLIAGIRDKSGSVNEERKKDFIDIFDKREITIPPLREREEDLLVIAEYLLKKMALQFRRGEKKLSISARSYLIKYHWPGNDKEMEDTIRKAYLFSGGNIIEKRHLFMGNISLYPLEEFLSVRLKGLLKEDSNLYATVIGEVEKALISIVMKDVEGNQIRASKILGINRNTLRSKLKEYGLYKNLTK